MTPLIQSDQPVLRRQSRRKRTEAFRIQPVRVQRRDGATGAAIVQVGESEPAATKVVPLHGASFAAHRSPTDAGGGRLTCTTVACSGRAKKACGTSASRTVPNRSVHHEDHGAELARRASEDATRPVEHRRYAVPGRAHNCCSGARRRPHGGPVVQLFEAV